MLLVDSWDELFNLMCLREFEPNMKIKKFFKSPLRIFLLVAIIPAIMSYLLFPPAAALFTIGFIAWVIYSIFCLFTKFTHQKHKIVISLVVTFIVLAAPAYFINMQFDSKVALLKAQNVNFDFLPKQVETVAILSDGYGFDFRCHPICMRLLLNGQIKKVTLVLSPLAPNNINFDQVGTAYWLKKKDRCQNTEYYSDFNMFHFSLHDWDLIKQKMKDLEDKNICLHSNKQKIGQSQAIVLASNIAKYKRLIDTGINPFEEVINARRFSLYVKKDGQFLKEFQTVQMDIYRHLPLLIPLPIFHLKNKSQFSYVRNGEKFSSRRGIYDVRPLKHIIQDRLGLKLAIQ